MTKREIANIARRMDEETRLLIDKEVEERLEILKEGELSEDELKEMEECLYASLVIQEFLNGEYDLLEEERQELFDHMEEMYNKYSDLLVRARIEEKVGKKKRMALELMKIREKLMQSKEDYKNIKNQMKENRENFKKLNDQTKKSELKNLAKRNKAGQKDAKLGLGVDMASKSPAKATSTDINNILKGLPSPRSTRYDSLKYDPSKYAQTVAMVGKGSGSIVNDQKQNTTESTTESTTEGPEKITTENRQTTRNRLRMGSVTRP